MRARVLCALVLLPFAASCWTWQPVPGAALAPAQPERIDLASVSLRDGTVLRLREATISADSVVGFGGTPPARVAVPRRDVTGVEVRGTEPITSFIAGALAAVGALFLALRLSTL